MLCKEQFVIPFIILTSTGILIINTTVIGYIKFYSQYDNVVNVEMERAR